jgi:hypothetical protein
MHWSASISDHLIGLFRKSGHTQNDQIPIFSSEKVMQKDAQMTLKSGFGLSCLKTWQYGSKNWSKIWL